MATAENDIHRRKLPRNRTFQFALQVDGKCKNRIELTFRFSLCGSPIILTKPRHRVSPPNRHGWHYSEQPRPSWLIPNRSALHGSRTLPTNWEASHGASLHWHAV